MDDGEPVIRIAVRDYVDREVERAVNVISAQFVTIETARRLAKEENDRHVREQGVLGRWTIERLMALAAIGIAIYAVFAEA